MATAAKIVRSLLTHRSSSSSSSSMTKSAFPPAFSRHSPVSNALLINRSRSAYSPLNSSNSMPPVFPGRDVSSNHLRFYRGGSAIQRNRFPKHQKGRIDGIANGGGEICFGKYGLQALEPARITSRQIEAGRRALQLKARLGGRGGKVWVRTFPYRTVTAKPSETRMGRGKGAISHWVAAVKPGQILYEMGGVRESLARKAIQIAGSKMPIRTKPVIRDEKIKEIGIR